VTYQKHTTAKLVAAKLGATVKLAVAVKIGDNIREGHTRLVGKTNSSR